MYLLQVMSLTSAATLMLGLLFGIVIILFVAISVLLIYSLLMISVETKTFENGVLRVLGMSKLNIIGMVIIQSFFFVLPSIICSYIAAIPILWKVYGMMFKDETINIAPIPGASATIFAILMGFGIPMVGSIVPIQVAMKKQLGD